MLTINVLLSEEFDDDLEKFVVQAYQLELEHSLASLSKWESKYEKPFLSNEKKAPEETLDYVRMMSLDPKVPEEVYQKLSLSNVEEINAYINAGMTATWFRELPNQKKSHEVITAEVMYHWLVALNIDMECQFWHLNRLVTLVRVVNDKNQPKKKMSRNEMLAQRHAENERRKAAAQSRG